MAKPESLIRNRSVVDVFFLQNKVSTFIDKIWSFLINQYSTRACRK